MLMKDLIERSYQSIRKRGKITNSTAKIEFIAKMYEELEEIEDHDSEEAYIKEVTDLAAVCINAVTHKGYDFKREFEKCVIHQETRKD